MRTHLEFVSQAFEIEPGEDDETNPGIFGKQLAMLLAHEFMARGYPVGEVIAEDWGWLIPLGHDEFELFLGCASYDAPPNWLVHITPNQPFVRKLFKKIDTQPTIARVADDLVAILTGPGTATQLNWWTDHDSGRK